jgi:hypothetical protein
MFGCYAPPEPPLHRWQGQSGKWYVFSIYPITAIPSFVRECNYIFARPLFGGTCEPFYIGESSDFTQELKSHPKLDAARDLGATEVHIHFLAAQSSWERLDIETDLRRGHWTPLNYQPTPARPLGYGGFGGLGAAALGLGGGLGSGLDGRSGFERALASMPPASPPSGSGIAGLAAVGGYPFATDLDWLVRKP